MLELSQDLLGSGVVNYRAIHAKTQWRKVNSHHSIENAVLGKDGATALFKGKARIDYNKHGSPTHAVVWQSGALAGLILVLNSVDNSVIAHKVPIAVLLEIDALPEAAGLPIVLVLKAIADYPHCVQFALT